MVLNPPPRFAELVVLEPLCAEEVSRSPWDHAHLPHMRTGEVRVARDAFPPYWPFHSIAYRRYNHSIVYWLPVLRPVKVA